jgi:hypothetical protein
MYTYWPTYFSGVRVPFALCSLSAINGNLQTRFDIDGFGWWLNRPIAHSRNAKRCLRRFRKSTDTVPDTFTLPACPECELRLRTMVANGLNFTPQELVRLLQILGVEVVTYATTANSKIRLGDSEVQTNGARATVRIASHAAAT